jgi:hypothetical protein
MGAIELRLAVGAEEEHAVALQVAEEVVEEAERSRIGPV